jgi:hypothetical protein
MANKHDKIDTEKVITSLNTVLELELAGVVRYLHYSLMVFGHARIPIIGWMRNQATEGMTHAAMAGEHVTSLGGHPSLRIGKLVETHKHDIVQILHEASSTSAPRWRSTTTCSRSSRTRACGWRSMPASRSSSRSSTSPRSRR